MTHPNFSRTGRASARLIVPALLLLAGLLLVFRLSRRPPSSEAVAGTAAVGRSAAPAAQRTAPADQRPAKAEAAPEPPAHPISPTDPLPRAAVAAGANPEEMAADLARQVLSGGGRAFPALVAAIQLAGFHIRNPDRSMLQPAGASQGIAFERYEVNALADLARERRTVSVPLTSFAEGVASTLPQLREAPMAALLLDGIRQHATDSAGPLLFWSMFIVELGRQAKAHPPYDLVADPDSGRVQLDAVQMAFIAKRLTGDMFAAGHPDSARKSVGLSPPLPVFFASYTQSGPCTFEDAAGKIVDLAALGSTTAFDGLVGYLESQGVKGAEGMGTLTAFANVFLAYLQLVISHRAFEMQFEMQGEPPLVRTREMRPRSGQSRTIETTVKMNTSKLEWMNCLRIPLNAMGLDFNVDGDGPIEGASVAWTGSAGFSEVEIYRGGNEQLVRYAGRSGQSIMNQVTDSNGKARVQVEGVGQRTNLGREPRPVMTQAVAGASVVLKPANLYRDLKDATSTALGGLAGLVAMPAELLYRTRWTFGGWYEFPVQDWKAGNGWSGSVSYTRIEHRKSSNKSERICCGGRTQRFESSNEKNETLQYRWEIPSDPDAAMLTPGFSVATAAYSLQAKLTKSSSSFNTGWASCRGGSHPQTSTSRQSLDVGQAEYEDEAQVTVELQPDSSFRIAGGGPGRGRPEGEMVLTEKHDRNDGCNGAKPTRTNTQTGTYRPATWGGHIDGTADPDADELSGSLTRTEKHPGSGMTTTHIYDWALYR